MERFHDRYPTTIDHELWLADHLTPGILMRHGSLGARRRLRRDAGGVFARMPYHRVTQEPHRGREWAVCFVGADYPSERDSRASSAEILTPTGSPAAWNEMYDRLGGRLGDLMTHDRDDRTTVAKVIRDLGFAVAETMATLWFFDGVCSWAVVEEVVESWLGRDQRILDRFPEDSFDRLFRRRRRPAAVA